MARLSRCTPLFLFLFSLIVRLVTIRLTHFDGLYGQDAFAYFRYALDLRQALLAGEPPPPFFWPIGYPLLVTIASGLAGPLPVMGQMVSMLSGAAIAPLVYLLVCEYRPEAIRGGIIAGLLAALAAQLLLSSLSVMADTASLFWVTLSAWLMVRYLRALSGRWLVLTAVTLTLATLTRWVYGLLAIPWGLSALLAWRAAHYSRWQAVGEAALAVVIGLSLLTLHFAPELSRPEISYVGDLEVYNWNPANALRKELANTDGRFDYEYVTGYFYARPAFHPSYIFPLLAPFWLVGLWTMRRQPAALAVLLAGWPVTVYVFLAGVPWQNWRFPLSFFPPLLVLVGLGLDYTWNRLSARWQIVFMGYCLLALLGSIAWAVHDVGRFTAWASERNTTAVTVASYLPPEATLIAFDLTATLQHHTTVSTLELFSLTTHDLAQIVAEETTVYLLLNPDVLQSQWVGKSPERNFTWLQTHTRLQTMAQINAYTLYQVNP